MDDSNFEVSGVADRKALLWLDTRQLRVMRLAAVTNVPALLLDGANGARTLAVTAADVDWALKVSSALEGAEEHEEQGDFLQAMEAYEAVLQATGRSDYLLMRIGSCWAKIGELHRALIYLEKAATLAPDNKVIRGEIALCLKRFETR